jgi:hypothetical protein
MDGGIMRGAQDIGFPPSRAAGVLFILQPLLLRQLVEEAAGAVGLRGRPGKLQCGAGPEQLDHWRRQYRPVD